jgi:hypothetical protein
MWIIIGSSRTIKYSFNKHQLLEFFLIFPRVRSPTGPICVAVRQARYGCNITHFDFCYWKFQDISLNTSQWVISTWYKIKMHKFLQNIHRTFSVNAYSLICKISEIFEETSFWGPQFYKISKMDWYFTKTKIESKRSWEIWSFFLLNLSKTTL